MKISDLKKMEEIVDSNPFLYWEGWDVVSTEKDSAAYMNKNAIFQNSEWHKKTVYKNEDGFWNIPDDLLRKGDVQV